MLPKLVMFDYGETLGHEDDFLPRDGFAAILEYASENPLNADADTLLREYREAYFEKRRLAHGMDIELPNIHRWRLLFGKFRMRFSLPEEELEAVFWNAAAPCVPTPGAKELLALLRQRDIKTGIISNMGFSGNSLRQRLEGLFPEHRFDFVVSSADCLLRKPDRRIFKLGLALGGCEAKDAWFLGDNMRCDIAGAAGAGIFAVHYTKDLGCAYHKNETAQVTGAYCSVDDWKELCEKIENCGDQI